MIMFFPEKRIMFKITINKYYIISQNKLVLKHNKKGWVALI